MNKEDKIKAVIEKGITCNPTTGKVYGKRGNELLCKNKGYSQISINYNGTLCRVLSHQFIYYIVHNKIVDCIDHINRDITDNRIDNLRSVSKQENAFNRYAKGYTKVGDLWQAQIKVNQKTIYLGRFSTKQEAHQTYLDAKKVYHNIN
jgi:hypothetical protein